jgi:hypothetical protein
MERDSRLQNLHLHKRYVPDKGTPLTGFPNTALLEIDAAFSEAYFNNVSEYPVGGNPGFPIGAPVEKYTHLQSLILLIRPW